jgi:zinc/manganese transport system permease protein
MNVVAMLGLPLLACLMMAGILGYLGLHVIKREVIFIDIAVAQVAALGAIAAHMVFHVHGDSPQALACAVGATLVAALFFAVARHRVSRLPIEATIGITYAIVAAGALFLIGKSTCGHSHIQEMLAGSLLWVEWQDLVRTAVVFAIAGAGFVVCRSPFQEISDNYEEAASKGRNVVAWDFLFYALCGIVITFAVRLAGVVVVFCFLIIPATTSALFATKWHVRLLIAWTAGAIASVTGLLFCQWLDFSAGVSVALFLGVLLAILSIVKCTRQDRSRNE